MKKLSVGILMTILMVGVRGRLEVAWADGPYRGKVIDTETKEPIEGAVVVAVWMERVLKFYSGWPKAETYFAEAKEALTDENGEFEIPGYAKGEVGKDKFGIQHPGFYIFKPGYGSYPRTHVRPRDDYKTYFRPYSVVELPKLRTPTERRVVRSNASLSSMIPDEKVPHWKQLIEIEEEAIKAMTSPERPGITWADGPYYGVVFDAATGKPIEGAVVVAVWWERFTELKQSPEIFIEAKEVLTDREGLFEIPGFVKGVVKKNSLGLQYPKFYIFKPGYRIEAQAGSSMRSEIPFRPSPAPIALKRLKTQQERLIEFGKLDLMPPAPLEKLPAWTRLMNTERISLGLEPIGSFDKETR